MKVIVDQDKCIGCGSCVNICSEVFDFNDDGYAEAKNEEVVTELEEDVTEAINGCPTEAIKETEEEK